MTVLITRDDMVAKAYEQYKHVSEDENLRARALAREKFLRDQRSSLKAARQEGIQEGMQEGRQATARVMRAKGYEVSEIAEITGLSAPEIEAL